MTDDTTDAEALLEQSKQQKRHETEPTVSTRDDEPSLVEAVADAYDELENDDLPENLTIRDDNLAALFAGLDETNGLNDVIAAAASALDREEPDADSKAAALRLLVRVGLDDVAPEVLDAGAEGYEQHREQQDYEF